MMMEENGSKKVLLSVLGVAILIVAVVGISFAAFTFTKSSDENSISTGSITMSYTESENGILLTDAYPLSDDEGKALSSATVKESDKPYFDFTVATSASGVVNIPYEINITIPTVENPLTNSQVKVYLTTVSGETETAVVAPKLISTLANSTVRTGSLVLHTASDNYPTVGTAGKSTSYRLRIWVDKAVDAAANQSKNYKVLVNVDSRVSAIS